MYYYTCSAIDMYNIRRCDYLKLEENLGTHSWDKRINTSILGVSVVDT